MNAFRRLSFAVLLLALLLAACAPAAATARPQSPVPTQVVMAAPTEAPMATSAPAATSAPNFDEAGAGYGAPAVPMVIKDATLELLVSGVDPVINRITQMTADNGGYVLSSQTWYEADQKHATLRLTVPAARFEPALNELRNTGRKVLQETTSGQDVSAEYTDLRAQLTNLEATAARVRAFLDNATTVEESLHINAELSRLEGDIERIKGQMHYYETRSAYSSITVTLTPEAVPAEPTPRPAWAPAKTFERATRVMADLWQAMADGLIWLVVLLGPFAVLLAVIVGLVGTLWRRQRVANRSR